AEAPRTRGAADEPRHREVQARAAGAARQDRGAAAHARDVRAAARCRGPHRRQPVTCAAALPSVLCAMALGALGACSMPRPPEQRVIDSYLADPRDLANVRRVMVLPFAEEPGVDDCTQMRDIYVAELQKLRRFDIVPLPGSALEVDELNRSVRHGRLSTDAVVRLCDRYHLDGVLVGTVTSFRAYT